MTPDARLVIQKRRSILLLSSAFAISRIPLYLLMPFKLNALDSYMQYLDPRLLRHDLLHSLYCLHTQPPLFNLFIGIVLKISPRDHESAVFSVLYFLMGLAIVCGSYTLMRYLQVRDRAAVPATILLMLFPPMLSSERCLYYAYPLALMLVAAALFLCKFIISGRTRYFGLYCAAAAAVVLSRSMFHIIVWMVPLLVMALAAARRCQVKRLKLCAAVSVAFVVLALSPYFKNYAEYDQFTSSTWQGMSIARMTRYIPKADVQHMVASGEVTPLALITPYSDPMTYYNYYQLTPGRGNHALDDIRKSNGFFNWNNRIYARAGQEYQRNSLRLILGHPLAYGVAVANETYIFFGFVPWRLFSQFDTWGKPRHDSPKHAIEDVGLTYVIPAVMCVLFILIVRSLIREVQNRRRDPLKSSASSALLGLCGYLLFNILYVFIVANFAELSEACWYRKPIDPLLFVGFALMIQRTRVNGQLSHEQRPRKYSPGESTRTPPTFRP